MKNLNIAGIALLAALLFFSASCEDNLNEEDWNGKELIMGDFSLTVTVDKTEARVGDTVTATVVFKNLSGRDIDAELPHWAAAGGGQSKEDILSAVFIPAGTDIGYIDILFTPPLPRILIESGAVIERRLSAYISEAVNLEIHAGAFFYSANYPSNHYGEQIISKPIRINIQ